MDFYKRSRPTCPTFNNPVLPPRNVQAARNSKSLNAWLKTFTRFPLAGRRLINSGSIRTFGPCKSRGNDDSLRPRSEKRGQRSGKPLRQSISSIDSTTKEKGKPLIARGFSLPIEKYFNAIRYAYTLL